MTMARVPRVHGLTSAAGRSLAPGHADVRAGAQPAADRQAGAVCGSGAGLLAARGRLVRGRAEHGDRARPGRAEFLAASAGRADEGSRAGPPEAARALVAQALRVVVALLPCVAIGAGSAHEIVRLVYGAGFDAAAHLSRPLLLAAFAMLLISVTTAVLIAADRASAAALCVWPMLPAAALAMALVVPHAGAYGAAVITAAAVSFSAGVCLVMLGRTVGVWPPVGTAHPKRRHRARRGRGRGLVDHTRPLGCRQAGRPHRADAAGLCGGRRVRPAVAGRLHRRRRRTTRTRGRTGIGWPPTGTAPRCPTAGARTPTR